MSKSEPEFYAPSGLHNATIRIAVESVPEQPVLNQFPLEWLWRSLAYVRLQPLRRQRGIGLDQAVDS